MKVEHLSSNKDGGGRIPSDTIVPSKTGILLKERRVIELKDMQKFHSDTTDHVRYLYFLT